MAIGETKPTKRSSAWNPFQKIETEKEALSAARSGAVVAGYLAISYALQVAVLESTGQDLYGTKGTAVLIVDVVCVLFALLLLWRIFVRQPRWAAIVVAVWYGLELAAKIATIAGGQQQSAAFYAVMYFTLIVAAVMGVRGIWKLPALRRHAAPVEVFD